MKAKRYRNTAFLIELLINVFVLCISCAVLVGVLVEASLVVSETNRQNAAGNEVYSLLQTLKAQGVDAIEHLQPEGDEYVCGYNINWQPVPLAEAVYTVRIGVENSDTAGAGTLQKIVTTAYTNDGTEICSFDTAYYTPSVRIGGGTV